MKLAQTMTGFDTRNDHLPPQVTVSEAAARLTYRPSIRSPLQTLYVIDLKKLFI